MTKYLIVNSDDFGISEDVSRGILEAHHNGIVTSTTTMVNMPAAESAIKKAQETAPSLGLGLHFVLSFGAPVSNADDVPSLVKPEGTFVSTYSDLMTKMPSFSDEDVEREMRAQFERFRDLAGRLPDHLDSHHGSTYQHPRAFRTMLTIAKEHNLPIRWFDGINSRYGLDSEGGNQLHKIYADHTPVRSCDTMVDFIFDFESISRIERLKTGLADIQEGYTELVVHVGYGKDLEEDYSFQRNQELEAVTNAEVKQAILDNDIQLCNFADLP